ncbi:GNAT family N-acetyltransferase, partial [Nocardioides sp.]|uniref:GNAT family N-acetyltransferase n=1 Tax=Nocardioides sp. TaxID=35761 RepID=UPI0025CC58D4
AADEASLAGWLTADHPLARFVALDEEGVARGHCQVTTLHGYTTEALRAVMSRPDQHLWEIGKLFVHPEHRRSGAGAALLDAATHMVLQQDRTPCVVVVHEWTAARELYVDNGFCEAARFDGKDGLNLVMVRRSS